METRPIFEKCLTIHTLGKKLDEAGSLLRKLEKSQLVAIRIYTDPKDSCDSGYYVDYLDKKLYGELIRIVEARMEVIAAQIRDAAHSLT